VSLCACCGQTLGGSADLCPHHTLQESDWATDNRIMCDFIHRGIVVSGPRERADAVEELEVA
jgi:hypothetical protein